MNKTYIVYLTDGQRAMVKGFDFEIEDKMLRIMDNSDLTVAVFNWKNIQGIEILRNKEV